MNTYKNYHINAQTYFTTTLPDTENIVHFYVNIR